MSEADDSNKVYVIKNNKLYEGTVSPQNGFNDAAFEITNLGEITEKGILHYDGLTVEGNIERDTIPPYSAFVIPKNADKRVIVFNEGLRNLSSQRSAISYLDGISGKLLLRGIPVKDCAQNGTFSEIAYLLLTGYLPSQEQLNTFRRDVHHDNLPGKNRHLIPNEMIDCLKLMPKGPSVDPMQLIQIMVTSLGMYYESNDYSTLESKYEVALNLLAKFPTIVAYVYRHLYGNDHFILPRTDLGYVGNFMRMCFADPANPDVYIADPVLKRGLEQSFILHADHVINASTDCVRKAASTRVSPYPAFAMGVGMLSGTAHGGANKKALEELLRIKSIEDIKKMIQKAEKEKAKISGFGHADLRTTDLRAIFMQGLCCKIDKHLRKNSRREDLAHSEYNALSFAMRLRQATKNRPYFQERNLYPNIDLYSGLFWRMIGFPPEMTTALFNTGRIMGMVAHFIEAAESKLERGRQIYTGEKESPWTKMEDRGKEALIIFRGKPPKHLRENKPQLVLAQQ